MGKYRQTLLYLVNALYEKLNKIQNYKYIIYAQKYLIKEFSANQLDKYHVKRPFTVNCSTLIPSFRLSAILRSARRHFDPIEILHILSRAIQVGSVLATF